MPKKNRQLVRLEPNARNGQVSLILLGFNIARLCPSPIKWDTSEKFHIYSEEQADNVETEVITKLTELGWTPPIADAEMRAEIRTELRAELKAGMRAKLIRLGWTPPTRKR